MTQPSAPASSRAQSAIPAGLALLMMLLGAMCIGLQRYEAGVAARMRTWPSTIGTVSRSIGGRRLQDGTWGDFSEAAVGYDVAGHHYSFTSSEYAGRATSPGTQVSAPGPTKTALVYYDPADPSNGSLSNERDTLPAMLWLGAGLFVLSLPLLYLAARMFRAPSASGATS